MGATMNAPGVVAKGLREAFARFFEDPSREGLRRLFIEHGGEVAELEFKQEWPRHAVLARHILAMANTGGGCLVIGTTENEKGIIEATGLPSMVDKADIDNGLKTFLPEVLTAALKIHDFHYEASEYARISGRKYQVVLVDPDPNHVPYLALKDSDGIARASIYVRRAGGTSVATNEDIQRIINLRIESGQSTSVELDLKQHLDQLKALYAEIPRSRTTLGNLSNFTRLFEAMSIGTEPNPAYPKESFEAFILRLIDKKKRRVAGELGVTLDD